MNVSTSPPRGTAAVEASTASCTLARPPAAACAQDRLSGQSSRSRRCGVSQPHQLSEETVVEEPPEDRHRSCGTPQDRGRIFPAGVKGVGGGDCRLQAISPGVGLPKRRLIGRRLGSRRFRISRRGVERSPVEVLTPTAGLVVVQKSAPSRRSRPTARPAKRSCRRREHGSTTNSPHR